MDEHFNDDIHYYPVCNKRRLDLFGLSFVSTHVCSHKHDHQHTKTIENKNENENGHGHSHSHDHGHSHKKPHGHGHKHHQHHVHVATSKYEALARDQTWIMIIHKRDIVKIKNRIEKK